MNHETAIALSIDLIAAGISHTIEVGIHENMVPQVRCRVDVLMPRGYHGGLAATIARMEEIGAQHNLILHSSMLGDGLTYSTMSGNEDLLRKLRGA